MKKFLIINPFGVGDVLFTTPVVRAIKEHYPDSIIGYWCNDRVQDILRNNKFIDKIFALSRGDLKKIYSQSKLEGIYKSLNLFRMIKIERFDISFDFSLDHRYGLLAKLSGVKRRIGFNYKNRGRFLTDRIEIAGYQQKHAVEYYLDLLKCVDLEPKSKNLDLTVSKDIRVKIKNNLASRGVNEGDLIIGLVPGAGASWGRDATLKHWPKIKFAQLADRLIEELEAKVIILGDESERSISEAIVSMMKNKPLDLAGKTDLEDLAAVIESLDILITNDGGPLHMACALEVKTVSIFGPVDDLVYGPYPSSSNHIVIKKDIACRPCYKNFRMPFCDKDRECIKSIDAKEVFEAVRKLI